MLGIHDYGTFVLTGIVLNLTPGQDTLYVVGRSLAEGRRVGVASALGIATGCLVHICAATFGLTTMLAASARAFATVKWVGVCYLIYLGVRQLLERTVPDNPRKDERPLEGSRTAFRRGILTNALNPKVALFFLAFLPQFVEPSGPRILSFLVLGATFLCTGTLWCLSVALLAASASRRLCASSKRDGLLKRLSGALLLGLGARLALQRAN